MDTDEKENIRKDNRWSWYDGKICFVQFMQNVLICSPNHEVAVNAEGAPYVTPALRGRVSIDGSAVRVEAALDGTAPEMVWTIGVHEGDIQAMSVVEKKLIA